MAQTSPQIRLERVELPHLSPGDHCADTMREASAVNSSIVACSGSVLRLPNPLRTCGLRITLIWALSETTQILRRYGGAALFRQRFIDGFGRFLNLGLAFARDDDRMGIGVRLVWDGAGDAGHPGGNNVDWPSAWQGKFL